MSRRVLLVNFLVMVALSVVAAGLVAFPPARPAVPEPLIPEFRPEEVVELRLTRGMNAHHAEPMSESVVRDASGHWLAAWGSSEDARIAWPVNEARVRAGLRMLADATLTPSREVGEISPVAGLAIMTESPGRAMIFFAEGSVAGRAAVSSNTAGADRPGLTDDRLHAVFAQTGLLPWRDERAMPGVARDPSRLVISAPVAAGSGARSTIEVARQQGRWGLTSPVVERAEAGAVAASIDALGRMTVASFRDHTDPAQAGLVEPRVTMEVSGGRGPDSYLWRIDIGAPATADGTQVFARLSGHLGESGGGRAMGPVYVVLPIDGPRIYTNAEAYLARTSLETPTADIRRFTIRTLDGSRAWRYERTLDGWTVLSPGAEGARAATAAEAAAIPVMLDTLTTGPADSSTLVSPLGYAPGVMLEVEGSAGLVEEAVTIGRSQATVQGGATGASPMSILTVQAGGVWRRYVEAPEAFAVLMPVGR